MYTCNWTINRVFYTFQSALGSWTEPLLWTYKYSDHVYRLIHSARPSIDQCKKTWSLLVISNTNYSPLYHPLHNHSSQLFICTSIAIKTTNDGNQHFPSESQSYQCISFLLTVSILSHIPQCIISRNPSFTKTDSCPNRQWDTESIGQRDAVPIR